MTELARAASSARARLAAAMSALDGPETTQMFARVALPLALASGALFRVESGRDALTEADIEQARAGIRAVLAELQETDVHKEAIGRALENVASCLGLTHELSELCRSTPEPMMPMAAGPAYDPSRPVSAAAALPGPTARSPAAYPEYTLESTVGTPAATQAPSQMGTPLSSTQNSPGVRKAPKPSAAAATSLGSTQTSRTGLPEPDGPKRPQARAPDPAAPQPGPRSRDPRSLGSGTLQSAGQGPRHEDRDPRWAAPASRHAPGPPAGPEPGAVRVEANLGTHSPTNFYKGLRGNDVVDHGGLFVATYDGPAVGTPLWLRVTLPGGYSFDANAVVRWTRRQGSGDTPPGFGATFVSLSPEARQLVYRFTKNREPLFHDDI
jgi:hypothetical protein